MLEGSEVVSCSPQMIQTIDLCVSVANTQSTIVITGESGVGKSMLASIIHRTGDEKGRPFIKVNCATIPDALIESELFGYKKGAFTGADSKGKKGLFEAANGGTIFLDEISELPMYAQSKLLGVLQEKEFTPVGDVKPVKVDVRVIAATNNNLWKLVKENKYREDLYYRLNVVPINIPSLRQRPEDIAPLITLFLEKFNKRYNCYKTITEDLISFMETESWYGNIRELENTVERLVVTTKKDSIDISCYKRVSCDTSQKGSIGLKNMLEQHEKEILEQACKTCSSTRNIAKFLKISQPSVVRKLQKHGIRISDDS